MNIDDAIKHLARPLPMPISRLPTGWYIYGPDGERRKGPYKTKECAELFLPVGCYVALGAK